MVKLYDGGVYLVNGNEIVPEAEAARVEQMTGKKADPAEAKKGTIAYSIMKAHNISDNMDNLRIRFDAMTSHDITFVGIIQTARASGMEKFPLRSTKMTTCLASRLLRSTAASMFLRTSALSISTCVR